jgi:hypothetical protein
MVPVGTRLHAASLRRKRLVAPLGTITGTSARRRPLLRERFARLLRPLAARRRWHVRARVLLWPGSSPASTRKNVPIFLMSLWTAKCLDGLDHRYTSLLYLFCTFSFSMSRAPLCGWGAPPSLCGGEGSLARVPVLRGCPPCCARPLLPSGGGVPGICYAVLRSSLACARVSLRLPRAPLPALSCLRFLGSTA